MPAYLRYIYSSRTALVVDVFGSNPPPANVIVFTHKDPPALNQQWEFVTPDGAGPNMVYIRSALEGPASYAVYDDIDVGQQIKTSHTPVIWELEVISKRISVIKVPNYKLVWTVPDHVKPGTNITLQPRADPLPDGQQWVVNQ